MLSLANGPTFVSNTCLVDELICQELSSPNLNVQFLKFMLRVQFLGGSGGLHYPNIQLFHADGSVEDST